MHLLQWLRSFIIACEHGCVNLHSLHVVSDYVVQNLLKLNVAKCESMMFSKQSCSNQLPALEVNGELLPAGDVGRCLGCWLKGDLSV